jgi:hypothetical protein
MMNNTRNTSLRVHWVRTIFNFLFMFIFSLIIYLAISQLNIIYALNLNNKFILNLTILYMIILMLSIFTYKIMWKIFWKNYRFYMIIKRLKKFEGIGPISIDAMREIEIILDELKKEEYELDKKYDE